jgi:hypothetical protein
LSKKRNAALAASQMAGSRTRAPLDTQFREVYTCRNFFGLSPSAVLRRQQKPAMPHLGQERHHLNQEAEHGNNATAARSQRARQAGSEQCTIN